MSHGNKILSSVIENDLGTVDVSELSSGIYFYSINHDGENSSKEKITIIKD